MSTEQKPLQSGFGFHTTAQEALAGRDLHGKIAIVTGGHGGIGLETTRVLSKAGATVIVGARNVEQAQQNVSQFNNVEVLQLDLSNPASIDAFAAEFLKSDRQLDILINNAGVTAPPEIKDYRGFDTQLATNYLGHFQLTTRLWEALKKSGNARVVSLSSIGHMDGQVDLSDLNFNTRPYNTDISYGQSKTACSLFAIELDKRGKEHGIRAFAVHPGGILTGLTRHLSDEVLALWGVHRDAAGNFISPEGFKTVEEGAATTVFCAANPLLEGKGGVYCEDSDIAEFVPDDYSERRGVRSWAIDPALAQSLWEQSEELLNIPHGTIPQGSN
ncbi:SDR family NAD(P)-dependent oxidoreductase [Paenibacillus sp. GCM10012306]|uniref:SDR family NAD(P)-dependent oxidoreductase n=1 Tax=Paenibacillus sp. GCM10012306 TaxID=3317342 RepID=UPI003610BC96